ncbi:NUDIX hydrolase [Salipiger mangrovisoli]|uniref:NUDIX hydrolase n=1 Tax=Salipiger mangrovisoli TaxID=2865933 RepID=A0ABR9WZ52_9RHOB|nr:NUDIX hydrolase [Salipiger mangrovisoli]MBE9636567.1 NUDIX hydrolase [Salipiger mangrovisoli]
MGTSLNIDLTAPGARQLPKRTHVQYAALCFRIREGKVKVLLITSRGRQRWTLPKGWPMAGLSPARAAAREAWEEAGVRGEVLETCVGGFTYTKRTSPHPHMALVYQLEVVSQEKKFPERGERKQRWVSPKRAAELVEHPQLARLLREFHPHLRKH